MTTRECVANRIIELCRERNMTINGLARLSALPPSTLKNTINDVFMMHNHNRNSLEARLKARVCELCGTTQGELFELHHVRKVKDLNGKERWEQCMIAKRRKTLVVCKPCHNAIHHGSKSQ